MNTNEMFEAIQAHATALGLTTEVVSLDQFCDPNEQNGRCRIAHVYGKTAIGNVISMGVAYVEQNKVAVFNKSQFTREDIEAIDRGGVSGLAWFWGLSSSEREDSPIELLSELTFTGE